jgi:hypothetical protein
MAPIGFEWAMQSDVSRYRNVIYVPGVRFVLPISIVSCDPRFHEIRDSYHLMGTTMIAGAGPSIIILAHERRFVRHSQRRDRC